jgi:hypothetical protein
VGRPGAGRQSSAKAPPEPGLPAWPRWTTSPTPANSRSISIRLYYSTPALPERRIFASRIFCLGLLVKLGCNGPANRDQLERLTDGG